MHERLPQQRIGAVGDDLVDVHVRLCAAAGLPDGERKVSVERAVKDLVAGGLDRVGTARIEHTKLRIGARRRELHDRKRTDDLRRHLLCADAEIFKAALRLRAPVTVGRYTHLAHRVMLQTVFHPVTSFRKNLRCRYYTPNRTHTASPQTRKSPDRVRTFVCRYSFSLPPAHISPRGAAPRAPGSARRACRSPSSWPSSWDCSGR